MSSLAKEIEQYLKQMLDSTNNGIIEIQRNLLSEYFHCVPSQINYVLSTRFTPAHGYMVETRRGGGGYVRIVTLDIHNNEDVFNLVRDVVGDRISQSQGEALLNFLHKKGLITNREATILINIVKDQVLLVSNKKEKELLRANILKHMIATVIVK